MPMPNNRNAQTTACNVCGYREARTKYRTRAYGKGADLLVIENVPVVVCPSCGQSQLTAETLYELERIKLHRHGPSQAAECSCSEFHWPLVILLKLVNSARGAKGNNRSERRFASVNTI